MENWGGITFFETRLLFDPGSSSELFRFAGDRCFGGVLRAFHSPRWKRSSMVGGQTSAKSERLSNPC
jgi:hypothetical protein